jgi:hypothetical protein
MSGGRRDGLGPVAAMFVPEAAEARAPDSTQTSRTYKIRLQDVVDALNIPVRPGDVRNFELGAYELIITIKDDQ